MYYLALGDTEGTPTDDLIGAWSDPDEAAREALLLAQTTSRLVFVLDADGAPAYMVRPRAKA
jgi:hypothetical protein